VRADLRAVQEGTRAALAIQDAIDREAQRDRNLPHVQDVSRCRGFKRRFETEITAKLEAVRTGSGLVLILRTSPRCATTTLAPMTDSVGRLFRDPFLGAGATSFGRRWPQQPLFVCWTSLFCFCLKGGM
jgi:hypothetical protein